MAGKIGFVPAESLMYSDARTLLHYKMANRHFSRFLAWLVLGPLIIVAYGAALSSFRPVQMPHQILLAAFILLVLLFIVVVLFHWRFVAVSGVRLSLSIDGSSMLAIIAALMFILGILPGLVLYALLIGRARRKPKSQGIDPKYYSYRQIEQRVSAVDQDPVQYLAER